MAAVASLLESFRAACAGEARPIPIEFDRGVVKRKRFVTLVSRALVIETSEDERIVENDETVVLRLDQDTLEHGRSKLEECLQAGHFSPAELCLLRAGDRRELDHLYCILTGA